MISRALLNAPFFIPKDADLLRNRKVNTKKRQNRHLPELAFLILGTYFTAPFLLYRFLQYMCWERGYDKDKLRKVIGSWKKHNGERYIGDVPQAIPHTGHRNKEHIA